MRGAGATAQALASARTYQTFFCKQLTSTALRIWKPCSASSGCASMYCIQPSCDVLPVGLVAGATGALVASPTVVPTSTIVAPASVRYFSAAFEAATVPVVPNGSSHVDGM